MSQTVWTVTRVAHGVVIRGCCGNTDDVCNCQPDQCSCPAPEKE